MQRNQLFSFLIVVGLLVTLPLVTVALTNQNFELRISALEEDDPTNYVITDVTDSSFRVSWITQKRVIGGIKLANGDTFFEDDSGSYHSVEVVGLKSSTAYPFSLLSGEKEFSQDDLGKKYTVTTGAITPDDTTFLVYGQVFSPDGFSFQQGGIITLTLRNATGQSQVLSTAINETGGYQFDLGGMLDTNLSRSFAYRSVVTVGLEVFISHDAVAVEKEYPLNFSNTRQIPNLYMGEVNVDIIPAIEGIVD